MQQEIYRDVHIEILDDTKQHWLAVTENERRALLTFFSLGSECGAIIPKNSTDHYQVQFKYCDNINSNTGKYPDGTRVRAKCQKRRLSVVG